MTRQVKAKSAMRQQEELEEEKRGKTLFYALRTGWGGGSTARRLRDHGGKGLAADLLEETVRKN